MFVLLLYNKVIFEYVEGEVKFGILIIMEYWLFREKIMLIKCSIFRKIIWGIKK